MIIYQNSIDSFPLGPITDLAMIFEPFFFHSIKNKSLLWSVAFE